MGKHTPGPWTHEGVEESAGYDCIYDGIVIRAGGNPIIILDAAEYGQDHSGSEKPWDRERMKADARLIAAAPDLLHTLETIRDTTECARTRVLAATALEDV